MIFGLEQFSFSQLFVSPGSRTCSDGFRLLPASPTSPLPMHATTVDIWRLRLEAAAVERMHTCSRYMHAPVAARVTATSTPASTCRSMPCNNVAVNAMSLRRCYLGLRLGFVIVCITFFDDVFSSTSNNDGGTKPYLPIADTWKRLDRQNMPCFCKASSAATRFYDAVFPVQPNRSSVNIATP